MKLSDEVIAHIAKLLQLAILTGTDIVDHLRMIKLDTDNDLLYLNEDYTSNSNTNIVARHGFCLKCEVQWQVPSLFSVFLI